VEEQAPRRSQRTRARTHEESEPPEQPTQIVFRQSRAKPATKPRPARTPAAKKTAQKEHPRPPVVEEHEEEESEEQDEEESEEEAEYHSYISATDLRDSKAGALNEIRKRLEDIVALAKENPQIMDTLQEVIDGSVPRASSGRVRRTPRRRSQRRETESPPPEPIFHIPKGPKSRKRPVPWTDEEERFLIDRVSKHGPKWSAFAKKYSGSRLVGRDQTALKDKARNIMLKKIEEGMEEEWLREHPMWAKVTVGSLRRGVHRTDGERFRELSEGERNQLGFLSDYEE